MRPFAAVQALLRCDKSGKPSSLAGSCFRLWSDNHYITAAHCVRDVGPDELLVMNPTKEAQDLRCVAIERHPEADIAIIQIDQETPEEFEKFTLYEHDFYYGQQIHCFGMVTDCQGCFSNVTQRVIGGITQRDFTYADREYKSKAIELSVPIPVGMSGGAAFLACKASVAMGVAIGTKESEVVVSGFEEYEDACLVQRERISRIVRYGVVLRLYAVKDWLQQQMCS